MKKLLGFACLVLALVTLTGNSLGAGAVEVWGFDVIKYGTYRGAVREIEDMEHSPGGKRRVVNVQEFLKATFKVPAIPGTRFGFRYVINGIPEGAEVPITIRKTYPGLRDPKRDKVIYNHKYLRIHEIGEICGTGYGFDHDWELVPGTWTFELLHKGNMLGEISFQVYKP